MSIKIHPVFHVSLLKLVTPGTRLSNPPSAIKVDDHVEFEVHRILDSKRVGAHFYYLVDWKGFGPEERSWEPLSNVHNSAKLVYRFHVQHPTKPKPIPVLKRIFGGGELSEIVSCYLESCYEIVSCYIESC